jgi:hypothetical protein
LLAQFELGLLIVCASIFLFHARNYSIFAAKRPQEY